MFGCPLVLWVPEGLAACGSLWQPVGTDWMPLYKSLEPSMPGGLDFDAQMQRWLAWLGWLAAAGGLLLAGCFWLMEGSLTRSTLQEVGGFRSEPPCTWGRPTLQTQK